MDSQYQGESSRSGRQCHGEHLSSQETGNVSSPMVMHSVEQHGGMKPRFIAVITRVEPRALYRACREAVRIANQPAGPRDLNRCMEWGNPRVPVLVAKGGDKQKQEWSAVGVGSRDMQSEPTPRLDQGDAGQDPGGRAEEDQVLGCRDEPDQQQQGDGVAHEDGDAVPTRPPGPKRRRKGPSPVEDVPIRPHPTPVTTTRDTEIVRNNGAAGGLVLVVEKDLVCTSESNKGPTQPCPHPVPTTRDTEVGDANEEGGSGCCGREGPCVHQ